MERLKIDLDFLGINPCTRSKIAAKRGGITSDGATAGGGMGIVEPLPGTPLTRMGWQIRPEGIYEVIARVHVQCAKLPIYITENGGAFPKASYYWYAQLAKTRLTTD